MCRKNKVRVLLSVNLAVAGFDLLDGSLSKLLTILLQPELLCLRLLRDLVFNDGSGLLR